MNSREHSLDNCYIPQKELQGVNCEIVILSQYMAMNLWSIQVLIGLLHVFVGTWF